jgi:endonuclease III
LAKTDTKKQEKAFATVLKKAQSKWSGEEADELDPIAELVFSFLMWNATARQADTAFGKIMAQVVDLNELRVSLTNEIIEMIGVRYPDAGNRVIRMLQTMMEIYEREYDYKMGSLPAKSKREQREYLDTLPGMTPFVAARVALLSFGAHAMPVDDRLLTLLIKAGVFESGTTPADAENWLTRQIKAGDAMEAYLALQEWADGQRVTIPSPPKAEVFKSAPVKSAPVKEEPAKKTKKSASTQKAATTKKVAKKTTKKKTAKKTTKKTTKKRVAKKK